ncbi:MAG: DUF2798 domain-containing protein [Paracoccaceae bacterium]|nr:DUF2798 domain-containing protein [Paracoccaceae bacterium]
MSNPKLFHLVFSFVMAAMMLFIMTFVVTWANIGFRSDFLLAWAKSYAVAYCVGVPAIYFIAPLARGISSRILGEKAL